MSAATTQAVEQSKRGSVLKKFPHVYVILFIIILLSAALTYIISPNVYDLKLNADGTASRLIDPASYHAVERNATTPWGVLMSIPKGMAEVASIIFFIFIIRRLVQHYPGDRGCGGQYPRGGNEAAG